MAARTPLSRVRIVDAAAIVADRSGLDRVSMRNVGKQLGVEAMSLYHHVADKEQLLDELANWVFERIAVPSRDDHWRTALTSRADSARTVLSAHPWALRLVDARRTPSPAQLRHHDAVLACLFANGFTAQLAAQVVSLTDSYVYGFVLTEQNLPFEPEESTEELVAAMDLPMAHYPHLARLIGELVTDRDYRYAEEFTAGLEVILDGIAPRVDRARLPRSPADHPA